MSRAPSRTATRFPADSIFDGNFRVISVLGAGGMGCVLKAQQLDMDRCVAIKIVQSNPDKQGEIVARFRAESKAVSRLNHPNIVKPFRVGVVDDMPYVAMEFVEGETLAAILAREKQLDYRRCRAIFAQILDAVEHAHEHGVVHRDLKPSNIMVSESDSESPQVKIVDFGIALMHDRTQKLTQSGEIVGTAAYISPEVCR
jgi:serine/threonine-protein kinase